MRGKFHDSVDVLVKVKDSQNDAVEVDSGHKQQLAGVSNTILVMKVFQLIHNLYEHI